MNEHPTNRYPFLTVLFLAGIVLFAIFISAAPALKWIAIAGLLLCTIAVYKQVLYTGDSNFIWKHFTSAWRLALMIVLAAVMGIWVGNTYRHSIHMHPWPKQLTVFAITAAAIGATEEIIFRGVLFYLMKRQPAILTIFISSIAHAGYKTLLFSSPFAIQSVNTTQLFVYTFASGLILGTMRLVSTSTTPPLVAHATWDVIVYGDSPAAPWWVW